MVAARKSHEQRGEGRSRRCIVTREVRPEAELIRFVLAPDGAVVPDLAAKLPGRGLWVSARAEVLERAVRGGYFSRAAKAPARAGKALPAETEAALARRCRELLSLARRAGEAVAGYEKVAEQLRRGGVALLVGACDGASGGKEKLQRLAGAIPVVTALTAEEIGLAFGRESVVHAAVLRGGLARHLLAEAGRLAGLRASPTANIENARQEDTR